MNPLAELHERLAYSATAGAALLEEDFRLKKIMDAFAPLAQKNPVFAKIHKSLADLFGAAPEGRGTLLLSLLGLVDAVLYTQAGYGMEGELAALPEHAEPGEFQQIRYSELSGIIQALTTTGSGRVEVLKSAIANYPEYFGDARVIHALISDLGDSYGEMAFLVSEVLQALATGQPINIWNIREETYYEMPYIDKKQLVRQLKHGFDPKGKTDMTKRMMLICTISGAEENDWYLSILDRANKDIRPLAVFALGFQEENIPLLMELAQKERGKAKEMAYRALCQWDTPEIVACIEKALDKNPKLAVCLSHTALDVYGDMAAKHLQEELSKILDEPYILQEQMEQTIMPWIDALANKASDGVIAFYRWISERKLPEVQEMDYNNRPKNSSMIPFFQESMFETLIRRCPQPLVDFLGEYDIWEKACFWADLFTKSASEVYDKWSRWEGGGLEFWMLGIEDAYDGMGRRVTDPDTGNFFVTRITRTPDVFTLEYQSRKRPLKEPLDLRWLDVFIKNDWKNLCIRVGGDDLPEEWRKKVDAYLYQDILKIAKGELFYVTEFQHSLYRIYQYGAKSYENLLLNLCKSCYNLADRHLCAAFTEYQEIVGEEATQREARQVLEFYRTTSENPKTADAVFKMLKENGFLKES